MIPLRTASVLLLTALVAGAETRVHITGTRRKSEDQILALLGARLEHVRRQDASPSRAEDAAFLLRQVMEKDGYAGVRVTWRIVSRNEIQLVVDEGQRLSLGSVTITGMPPEQTQKLVKLYSLPAAKDRPLTAGESPFREDDIETGLSYLRQELNAQGHWSAEVALKSRETDESGSVNVEIEIQRGPLFEIRTPRIESPDPRGLEPTRAATRGFVGRKATTGNLNAMRLAVEQAFVSSGYPDSRISMGRTLDGGGFIPEFHVELGKRVRLREIHVDGLEMTDPGRIKARLANLEGDWYDEAAMNKRVRAFLATGAFSSVLIDKEVVSEDSIDATLHFEEGRARQVSIAAGADSYQGAIVRFTYADRNLMGSLRGFSSGFEFSSRGVLGETKVTDPWLFGTDVSGTARLYALNYVRDGYTALETGLDLRTTWKWGDHFTLDAVAGYSIVNLAADGLPFDALGETVYTHPRLTVTPAFDYRDSPVLPTKGWHLQMPLEVGAAIGEISSGYFQTGMNAGWYRKLNELFQVGIGGEWALLMPSGEDLALPIDLRLFNGGARSVRSFEERDMGPRIDGYPLGGEASWTTNVELVRTISGSFKAVAFVDAGTLAGSFDEFFNADIELAAGLGVRLDLPIGPVRFEYGYNLTKDPGEPTGTFHFAIGSAF